jgi:hypothetical protein
MIYQVSLFIASVRSKKKVKQRKKKKKRKKSQEIGDEH